MDKQQAKKQIDELKADISKTEAEARGYFKDSERLKNEYRDAKSDGDNIKMRRLSGLIQNVSTNIDYAGQAIREKKAKIAKLQAVLSKQS